MHNKKNLLFNKDHLWCLHREDNRIVIGISDHCLQRLGDLLLVELPGAGSVVRRGKIFGRVTSRNAVNDLLSPVDGRVINANNYLGTSPATVNADPYGEGWMLHIQLDCAEQLRALMSAALYRQYIEEEHHTSTIRFASA